MSTTFRAEAIIGVAIPREKIFQKKPHRNCEHKIPNGAKFCPTCGKEATRLVDESIINIPDLKYGYDNYEYMCDWGYLLSRMGLSMTENQDDELYFIGIATEARSYDEDLTQMVTIPDSGDLKQQLKDYLEPIGLWDESKFGLWSVMTWG